MTVTRTWLDSSPLKPLEGAEGVAEKLVLLLHYGGDFTLWGGARRVRYWDALAERVKAATYAGPALADWWSSASTLISSNPRNEEERRELVDLLEAPNQRDVLRALRNHAAVLVLRVRVVSEHRRSQPGRDEA